MPDWAQKQKEYTERFGQQMEAARLSTLEFWRHLAIIEATVLALTVGLAQGASGRPTPWLAGAWVLLLVGIASGSLLIKTFIDLGLDASIRVFRAAHDLAEIQGRVDGKELVQGSEEYKGLFTAALSLMPEPGKVEFTPEGLELVNIPLHHEHPFQSIANADSEAWRTPIPGMANSHSGHREH